MEHCRVHKTLSLIRKLRCMNPIQTLISCLIKIHFNYFRSELKRRNHSKDLTVDRRIMFIWLLLLGEKDFRLWIGFTLLKIGTVCEML